MSIGQDSMPRPVGARNALTESAPNYCFGGLENG